MNSTKPFPSGTFSLVYRHILIYRLAMNLLYKLKYRQRFRDMIEQIDAVDRRVLELCFGDTYIAKFCQASGRSWQGLDINPHFVRLAQKNGFHAERADLLTLSPLPPADVCIISGSLYHFIDHLEEIFAKMLAAAPKIILSEPISNLSDSDSWLGRLAKKAAKAGKGDATQRFNRERLLEALNRLQDQFSFHYWVIKETRDLLVVIRHG